MNSTNKASFLQHCYRWLLRFILICHYLLLKFLKLIPHKPKKQKAFTVLATGTFYSDHWLVTHLRPMANASNCASLTMVASIPVPELSNVSGAYAPKWLTTILGQVGARLIYFTWLAITKRPDVLVGFHILVNGLFVVILAKIIGAKSVYICGGGPREVRGGGIETENRIFNRIGQADYFIEKMLLKAANEMDLIVSMGTSAITYFKEKGIDTKFEIVPGGFDDEVFQPNSNLKKKYDLILIGRLSDVKRVDRFLHAIKQAKNELPELNAVIVGDGPDKKELENLTIKLGIASDVDFVGWQNNIHIWLQQSKCFVLTSDSEGLSQALIQAMMTGLPAITSDVGDLNNLTKKDYNGYLVSELDAENFSNRFIQLFKDKSLIAEFSHNALESTKHFSVTQVQLHWNKIFDALSEDRIV
ncbi:glycosyltransferase [uncultured Psychromonas sp.]|uniref:glycosyltransferase n=1 Tax=uncultured Psychromonas sp. TaxID=173974 RepID=UPI00260F073A|nr:glycosyltransferase [uncultured Psychromonas sp.]